MISYIKIYGPPLGKALDALREMSLDMPEVCIMDTALYSQIYGVDPEMDAMPYSSGDTMMDLDEGILSLFGGRGDAAEKKCDEVISNKGEKLGEYDFFFEWFKAPTTDQVEALIEKIDETLEPLGVRYTITTKRR
jgi:hypothetical protein